MASKTTNYNLDMPGYNEVADIDVINGNMDKIDVQMKKNADSAQQSKDIVSDEYSATNTYAVGDYCIHENILYKCKTAITTGEAFDSNKWIQTTCRTEFRELNSNLCDYNLNNKCNSLYQGYANWWDGNIVETVDYIHTNYISVNDGDLVTIKAFKNASHVIYYNSSKQFVNFEVDRNKVTVPSGVSYIVLNFNEIGITPQNAGHVGVYVDNEIDQLKNDLGGLSFSASGTTLTITDGTNTWTLSN